MKSYGVGLLLIGAATSLSAMLFINTTLPGTEVINLGRLQMQGMLFQGGCALFLAGAVFAAMGQLALAMASQPVSESTGGGIPVVGISAAIAGTIGAVIFAFGSVGDRSSYASSEEPVAASVENNADALAARMEAEADRMEAKQ